MIHGKVLKTVLSNGLTVLCLPRHNVPKVSFQLWYNVGSKDEKTNEKGIAHLIEHMIFKGTERLSESDINIVAQKLSAYINAFTSYDYTGYLFDIPSQHWHEVLEIMSDCMSGCLFKEELLFSELKAVIQELKMYNDDYVSTVVEKMISTMFSDHPYHYPIIGHKHDLWNLKRENLVAFYNKHYIPNNATLVVVGDIDPHELFAEAQKKFGSIPRCPEYKKEEFNHSRDVSACDVTIHRDVKQPILIFAWVLPGAREGNDFVHDVLSWIVGSGRSSRLYKHLVEEKQLATEVETFVYDLFDASVFFVYVQPNAVHDREKIAHEIQHVMRDIRAGTIRADEVRRGMIKNESDYLNLTENNQKTAYLIGKLFLAMGDENALFTYCASSFDETTAALNALAQGYLHDSLMYRGAVLPLKKEDVNIWKIVQEQSDSEDARVLGRITRSAEVEPARYAHGISVHPPKDFPFPQAQSSILKNGLKILRHHNSIVPKIELILDFKAKFYDDPKDQQGLLLFLFDALEEGTKKYSAQEFSYEIESRGMELHVGPGQITLSMLSRDFEKGIELLAEMLFNPRLDREGIELVRARLLSELAIFWDNPEQFVGQLAREAVYAGHPYSNNAMGRPEVIEALTREEIVAAQSIITPAGTRMSIVGDLGGLDVDAIVEKYFGSWRGAPVKEPHFPVLHPLQHNTIKFPANRDQIVLALTGLSIKRSDPRFDAVLLYDQILVGGVLSSMASRLFELRERSGLFYSIGGSLLSGAELRPGMVYIRTIVSADRCDEAERSIREVLARGASDITDDELTQAKDAVVNALTDYFSTNRQMAATFLAADLLQFPIDHFEKRAQRIMAIRKEEVQDAVASVLHVDQLVTIKAGRIA